MKKLNLKIKDMPYAAEEALNRLRVNIKFCGKNTKKIVITSSVPNEGKSTVSVRLWKLLSEAGFPTVLVDVDLRKSEIRDKYSKWTYCSSYYIAGESICFIGRSEIRRTS